VVIDRIEHVEYFGTQVFNVFDSIYHHITNLSTIGPVET